MPKALQPAVNLTGNFAGVVIEAVQYILDGPALRRDGQILHGYQLGNGKAVMHLKHGEFIAWVSDAGLFIGTFGRCAGGTKIASVPGWVSCLETIAVGQLQRLD